jgi:phosphoheptose isomerase
MRADRYLLRHAQRCNLMHFAKNAQKLINVFEGHRMYYSECFIDCNISVLEAIALESPCLQILLKYI